jgi:hypothetical protein
MTIRDIVDIRDIKLALDDGLRHFWVPLLR